MLGVVVLTPLCLLCAASWREGREAGVAGTSEVTLTLKSGAHTYLPSSPVLCFEDTGLNICFEGGCMGEVNRIKISKHI